ncbi:MAG: TonB-dependent receptor [Sphingorhabdus sp.]
MNWESCIASHKPTPLLLRQGSYGAALLLGTCLASIPHVAHAQSADGAESDSASTEIVVTARKREESVQDVPATIDVFSGDDLTDTGVLQPRELQFAVPGFYVQNFETRATITLRGVGSQVEGGASSVATHLNGIYQSSSAAQLNRLFDIERLEIVKGPQGTLYGRNSTGGALNIITKRAKPGGEFEGDATASYGSYNTIRLDGGVSVPLGQSWGVRLAGSFARGDGIFENVSTGKKVGREDFWGLRGSLSGEIGDVKVDAFAQFTRDDDTRNVTLIPLVFGTRTPLLGLRKTAFDDPTGPITEREAFTAGLTIEAPLSDALTLRSISGYLDYSEPRSITDVNPRPNLPNRLSIAFPQASKQFSQELQLLYQSDRLNGVLGAYYLNDRQEAVRVVVTRPANRVLIDSVSNDDVDAIAVFGDVNFNVTDQLTLNAGLRWNRDKVRNNFVGSGLFDGDPFDLDGNQSKVTWRVGTDYEISPGYMLYGSVSTGFQAGRFDTRFDGRTGNSIPNEVQPERLMAYEIGAKTNLPDELGYFNIAAFQYDYKDLQVTIGGLFLLPNGDPDPAAPPFFFTDNAANSRIRGVEVQLSDFRVADSLKFDINAAYLDAKYRNYTAIVDDGSTADFSGNVLPRSPKWTMSSAVTLDNLMYTDNAEGSFRAEVNYRSRTFFTRENEEISSQGGYALVNLIARVDFDDGRWGLRLTARNLFDTRRFNFLRNDPFATVGEFRNFEAAVNFRF